MSIPTTIIVLGSTSLLGRKRLPNALELTNITQEKPSRTPD
jgi:hypothetical protein